MNETRQAHSTDTAVVKPTIPPRLLPTTWNDSTPYRSGREALLRPVGFVVGFASALLKERAEGYCKPVASSTHVERLDSRSLWQGSPLLSPLAGFLALVLPRRRGRKERREGGRKGGRRRQHRCKAVHGSCLAMCRLRSRDGLGGRSGGARSGGDAKER